MFTQKKIQVKTINIVLLSWEKNKNTFAQKKIRVEKINIILLS